MKNPVLSHSIKAIAIALTLFVAACGPNKKDIAMKLHSDPLGAYALMQVKYKESSDSDWIFLGPTPITTNKKIVTSGATSVSLKVVRPGFYEQKKTWKLKDFLKEHKQNKEIVWIPSMVQQ